MDDDVANWYVRLSRHRFYEVEGDDNRAAFATLHEVLTVTSRLLAPFCPFVTDWLHRELTGTSVHLAPFVRETRAMPVHAFDQPETLVGQGTVGLEIEADTPEAAGVALANRLRDAKLI